MSDPDRIKQIARERGQRIGVPYAGALLPQEAHALMQAGAVLVDVRTHAELYWVGHVPGSVFVEWSSYPQGQLNPDFLAELSQAAPKDAPVMFMCRSGGRSHNAALLATRAGWRECYNVLEGFEGDRDDKQQRSTLGGWKRAGLPWVQS
jgi:rhodanese-related sulfurtransferase